MLLFIARQVDASPQHVLHGSFTLVLSNHYNRFANNKNKISN
jgi:hypothetical protein